MFTLCAIAMGMTAVIAGMMTLACLQESDSKATRASELVTQPVGAAGSEGWLTAIALAASIVLAVIAG